MKKLLIFAFSVSGLVVFAQKTHTVEAKENPYSISKKYGISIDELYKLNPKVKDGKLNIGDVLVISKKADEKPKNTTEKPVASISGNVTKIVLQPKQTIYGITKQYHIAEADLRKLNPELDSHLKIGDEVTLPAENVKKYADKNAFNRNFAVTIPSPVVETSKKADEKPKNTTEKPVASISGNVTKIVLQPKQTIYGITKQYHIAEADLRKLNPELDSHLKIGDEVTLPAENVKKYADKNAFNRNFAVTIPSPVVETPKIETPAEKSTADEGSYVIQPKDNYYKITKSFGISQKDLVVFAQKTHTVEAKENPYSISKKYGISIDELYKLNPKVKDGKLNIGDVLVISKKADEKPKNTTEKPVASISGNVTKIVLQPKQTIYGITKQYHIAEADLRKLNPELDSHLKIGDEVTLPAENVKKYADKNAFNRNFAVTIPSPVVETPKMETPTEKSTADEGSYVIQPKDNYYKITKSFGISQKDLVVFAQKTHTVEAKENPYSISKKYGISIDELYKLNPKVKDGKLNIGDVLVISKKADEKPKNTTEKPVASISGNVTKIVLQPKQTIYGITKQYHISEADLRKLNPNLDQHMKIGDEVTLPAENIKKYADQNAFVKTEVPVEKPVEKAVEKPKADEGTYVIQPKDNYYRITKSFNLTQEELFAINPGLEEKGLQPGEVINVKKPQNSKVKETVTWQEDKKTEKAEVQNVVADEYQTYTVQNGDTVFGILNKFNVSLDQLLELNPKLSEGLKPGMVLKVKKLEAGYVKKSGDELNVVLMLPFGFDDGDSKYRSMAADFLTGAKLAIERNAKAGQKLDVKVVDAGSEASFKNSLTQINQNNTDLIIGPFFKSNVLEVLDYVKTQKIPVVAPFANSPELRNYSNLVIIETEQSVFADRIVKEVSLAYSDQKIYIVADSDKTYANYMKKQLEGQLKNANITVVNSSADIQLDTNMMTGQTAPVIAILANDNDDAGSDFSKRIIDLAKETSGMKSFSMYYHPSFEKNIAELSNASLVYLMDRKINTDGDFEKEVLADYKKKYCKAPSKYAVIGFDVVNDMLTRENSKGELFKQMNKPQTQLATKFEFVRNKNGAYVNQGYRVVRLVP